MRFLHNGPDRSFPFELSQLTEPELRFLREGDGDAHKLPSVVRWYRVRCTIHAQREVAIRRTTSPGRKRLIRYGR